jgi:hypothetical protein
MSYMLIAQGTPVLPKQASLSCKITCVSRKSSWLMAVAANFNRVNPTCTTLLKISGVRGKGGFPSLVFEIEVY